MNKGELVVKKANLEAYNRFGATIVTKEKYWSMVEDYYYSKVYALIEKHVGVKGKKVCELGCGTAACLKWYKRDCREIVGLDLSNKMMRLYLTTEGNSPNLNMIKADALTLPFKTGAFDIVTIYQSAHHFPNIYTCMDEMLRVASAFAFFEPNKDSLIHRVMELWRERVLMSNVNDGRFDLQSYGNVEYNSMGFSASKIRSYLNKRRARVEVHYIFALPMEISAKILRKSRSLFLFLTFFGEAFTHVPIVKSQFGGLLVIANYDCLRNRKRS